jgi:DNA invertase Pin-like site-specific DNA recombinase
VARGGDKLVVTALSRLARSVPDAHELLSGLAAGEVTLAIGEDHHPPSLPVTHVLVEVLALTAQLQTGLDSRRTRVGLAAARTRGQLRGRPPKLNHRQERHIVGLYWTGRYTVREIGELFNVSRSTVYRAVRRADRTADSDAAHSAVSQPPGCSQH